MNVQFTPRADRDYDNLSPRLQRAVDQQLNFLREKPENLRHPSIQAKKYSETDNIWQGQSDPQLPLLFSNRERYLSHPSHHGASEISARFSPRRAKRAQPAQHTKRSLAPVATGDQAARFPVAIRVENREHVTKPGSQRLG
jgi:hypothetical protein